MANSNKKLTEKIKYLESGLQLVINRAFLSYHVPSLSFTSTSDDFLTSCSKGKRLNLLKVKCLRHENLFFPSNNEEEENTRY